MTEFKVGDTVRILVDRPSSAGLYKGDLVKVLDTEWMVGSLVVSDGLSRKWYIAVGDVELVESTTEFKKGDLITAKKNSYWTRGVRKVVAVDGENVWLKWADTEDSNGDIYPAKDFEFVPNEFEVGRKYYAPNWTPSDKHEYIEVLGIRNDNVIGFYANGDPWDTTTNYASNFRPYVGD